METPSRNTLAIIGAGPVGLEAAAQALERGLDVHLFERGEVGSHPLAWGHVRMFTPWRMNLGPASVRLLEKAGWQAPDPGLCPTGRDLAKSYLQPLAETPELAARIHPHVQVVHLSRRGLLKGDSGAPRREHPFRILARDVGGRESYLHAHSLIDASGVYGQPSWAGDGGIPARQELYLAPQMAYHLEDVLGEKRDRYAGKRTMVIGAGASAATTVSDLARLAEEAPGTTVLWVTRKAAGQLYPNTGEDPLPERQRLYERARALPLGAPAVTHVGPAALESLEYNSATHRYRITLRVDGGTRLEEADRVVVQTGYGPDASIHRELQVHECYASAGPMKLAAALLGSGARDCLTVPAFGVDVLAHPEPNFFILGHKSYGRTPHFLLETGYRQAHDVVEYLASPSRVGAAP